YSKDHGTWVSSIIGAEGDNSTGVAGINWDVKLLPISGVTNKARILVAYDYIYRMRKAYNDSNGEEGAFILVTNYSGGIDKQFGSDPSNQPWCNYYDLMGLEGILSVVATVNDDINVDVEGDMPSTCSSPYVVAVTNLNQMGSKPNRAGYGNVSIDLGAPGENIYGAEKSDNYGYM